MLLSGCAEVCAEQGLLPCGAGASPVRSRGFSPQERVHVQKSFTINFGLDLFREWLMMKPKFASANRFRSEGDIHFGKWQPEDWNNSMKKGGCHDGQWSRKVVR